MGILLRSLKLCLTSEGQQAVLAAIICLLVLQISIDSTAALQVSHTGLPAEVQTVGCHGAVTSLRCVCVC